MATVWDASVSARPSALGLEHESLVRATFHKHLLAIHEDLAKNGPLIDPLELKNRLIQSLAAFGVSDAFLNRLSGNVEHDSDILAQLDVEPLYAAAFLKSARVLVDQKKYPEACDLLRKYLHAHPQNAEALVILARAEVGQWHFDMGQALYQQAIALEPARLEAYSGLATLYERTERYELADQTWRQAFEFGALYHRAYTGTAEKPIRILLITSVLAGNIRFMRFLNTDEFEITSIIAESYTPNLILPEHDILFQAIGDPELCVRGVKIAQAIAERSTAPLLNNPLAVAHTGREENARRLSQLENVVTPHTLTFDREKLSGEDAEAFLFSQGFSYPFLMRSPGYFNGRFFEKISCKEDIQRVLAELPGRQIIVIQYIDTMRADGTIRKYRIMGIDKKLYPLHLAISYNWKIHYFSANMGDKQEFRDEEYAYLYHPEQVLGPKVMKALADIVEFMGLDYCGIDFTVNDRDEVVVFEANATMALHLPDNNPQWDYRRQPIQAAMDAAKNLVYSRLGS